MTLGEDMERFLRSSVLRCALLAAACSCLGFAAYAKDTVIGHRFHFSGKDEHQARTADALAESMKMLCERQPGKKFVLEGDLSRVGEIQVAEYYAAGQYAKVMEVRRLLLDKVSRCHAQVKVTKKINLIRRAEPVSYAYHFDSERKKSLWTKTRYSNKRYEATAAGMLPSHMAPIEFEDSEEILFGLPCRKFRMKLTDARGCQLVAGPKIPRGVEGVKLKFQQYLRDGKVLMVLNADEVDLNAEIDQSVFKGPDDDVVEERGTIPESEE